MQVIPTRIVFVEKLLPKGAPLHVVVETKPDEGGR
jgi:hypothetical protein